MEHNLALEKEISIEGILLMLDDTTPHVAVPVQAICEGEVVATALSSESGRYQLVNLRQGRYQVRCHVLGGYVYYGEGGGTVTDECRAIFLQVKHGVIRDNINFRFAPFKKGTWRSYTCLDGLPYSEILAIYRDPDGVMWFGTNGGGVSRYDGRGFVNLTARDGLASNRVHAIYCDPDSIMWFGTEGGVSRYDDRGMGDCPHFVNFTTEDGLVDNRVLDIHCDRNGVIWFATRRGVSRYDGSDFLNLTTEDGLVQNDVRSIQGDTDGVIWFAMHGGVSRYDGERFVNLTVADGLADRFVSSVCCDLEGIVWVGTDGGVSRYDGREIVNFTEEDGLVNNKVRSVCCDLDGVMWFGSLSGVSRYDGKTFVNFAAGSGLINHGIIGGIYCDPDGTLWFGTYVGVSRYDRETLVNFSKKDGLAGTLVRAIHRDHDGDMWIGTFGGISRYDGEQFANFIKEDGLVDDRVNVVLREPNGIMWAGTDWGGVSRYDGKQFVNFTPEDGSLPHHRVNAIYRDLNGVIWFGTGLIYIGDHGGLVRYDGRDFVTFTTEDGLPSNEILAICGGPDGTLWIGTAGGLSRYDGKHFVSFTTEDGLVDDSVSAIYCDADGVMWFGTSDGVSRYNGKEFVNFTTQDGLVHGVIIAIRRTTDGLLWFGAHGGGVSMYDGTAWSSLDTRDGLAGNHVRGIDEDPDGNIWFATAGGLVRYRRNLTVPEAHIVSITTDQTYTDRDAISEIIAGQRITIEYAALDFKTIPEKQQYRCRIQAFGKSLSKKEMDSDWRKPTKATSFDYNFDKPGEYTFEVQAIDRDLNYSEPATLNLTIQPDPVLVSMQAELNHLRREVGEKYHFESIIGRSAEIRYMRALMERAIDSGLDLLITGETGTGKELVAKAIHYNSPRRDRLLLARNCGAIPKELLASELFGHRKGAFTGANEDKAGLFEAASGGTVLLDEIGEIPEEAQIHLLRVLQERKVQRLGEMRLREVDVRVVAITNRDLAAEVKAGRFREDLFYRLNVFPVHVPPLRERSEDIPLLAEHFLKEACRQQSKELGGFSPEVVNMLISYSWPGNVRELEHEIYRAAALAEVGMTVQTYHFSSNVTHGESLIQQAISDSSSYAEAVDAFRKRFIQQVLAECGGNRHKAARRLRMNRPNLLKLMKRLDIGVEGANG